MPEQPTRLVIFDDAKEALKRYGETFAEVECQFLTFRKPIVDEDCEAALVAFRPHLIIVDLEMGRGRMDGYQLIAQLREVPFRGGVPPIIVCSKFITDSPMGQGEREAAESQPGVVAAFQKFPSLPTADQFLSHSLPA